MDQSKIGRFISELRKENNLTQEQLANKLGITKNAISKWERGICLMDISLLDPLSKILNVSVLELLNGEKINDVDLIKKTEDSISIVLTFSKEKINEYRKKVILSFLFLISLSPMLLNQYGALKGVQEISGIINLINPIGLLSFISYFLGVWINFKHKKYNRILGSIGVIGIIISEIYQFLTWHNIGMSFKIDFLSSISNAFPEFYFGLFISIIMSIVYFRMNKEN